MLLSLLLLPSLFIVYGTAFLEISWFPVANIFAAILASFSAASSEFDVFLFFFEQRKIPGVGCLNSMCGDGVEMGMLLHPNVAL